MKNNIEELLSSIGSKDFKKKATKTKKEISKEFKKIVKNIKTIDIDQINSPVNLAQIKDNLNQAINKVQDLEILEFAKGKVNNTKNQVFSALNIPSQVEFDVLSRKLGSLEKKFRAIQKNVNK
ncbi:hypothetical protein BVY03_03260 [bacterium K02(2017)]|nr:hypothetical protein BVY03_03260 [bacterium K02(2017)]